MTLGELFDNVRDQYLESFRQVIADQERSDPPTRYIAEPIYRDEQGEPVREGNLDLPMRGDLFLIRDEPEGLSIDSEGIIGFDPVEVEGPGGLALTFTPFVWDMLDVTLAGVTVDGTDWAPLVEWFGRWFDEEDEQPIGEDGLSGVVHALTDPALEDGAVVFTVDLGSAPAEALEDLIDTIADLGATSCRFGTPHEEPDAEPEPHADREDA